MTSFARRAGQQITRLIEVVANPAAEAARVLGFVRGVGGVPQLFARSPDFARQVSGTGCNIFDKPLVPHALDDEFDSTTLDPAWTIEGTAPTLGGINPYANPGARYALHTNYRPSWLMAQAASGGNTRWVKDISTISAANFFVWMRASFNVRTNGAPVNNDSSVSFDLSANPWSTNNRVSVALNEQDAGTVQAEFHVTVGGVNTTIGVTRNMFVGNAGGQPIQAVGIQKIGTTYHGWAFSRAGSAIWLGSTVYAAAVSTVALSVLNASFSAPGTMLAGFDFVRFKDGSTYLP